MNSSKDESLVFTQSRQEMMTYVRNNKEALFIFSQGINDYLAARCLVLNGLMTGGYAMAGQAIEKSLKAQYRLRGGASTFRNLGHDISGISQKLRQECGLDLSHHAPLMERMKQEYENRYPDNVPERWTTSGSDLQLLDEFMSELFEKIPLSQELRLSSQYHGVIYGYCISPDNWHSKNQFRWLTESNDVLAPLLVNKIDQCQKLLNFWYPSREAGSSSSLKLNTNNIAP